jgi:hypothetical protein
MADEKYSLAQLIKRVIGAGWPAEMFAEMRKELHPKVLETLEEFWDNSIVSE